MAKRKLSARQIRWLFATGKLRASGKGKDRKVTYSKEGQAPKRAAIGGSKAAGLRSGSGTRDFSATRADRIAAGKAVLDRADLRVRGYTHAVKYRQPGQSVRDAARGETTRRKQFEARAKREARIEKAQRASDVNPKVQSFRGIEERVGRDGAIRAFKTRADRIKAGREVGRAALEKRRAAYNPLFGAPAKPDYSATRAARIKAGKAALASFSRSPRGYAASRSLALQGEVYRLKGRSTTARIEKEARAARKEAGLSKKTVDRILKKFPRTDPVTRKIMERR